MYPSLSPVKVLGNGNPKITTVSESEQPAKELPVRINEVVSLTK